MLQPRLASEESLKPPTVEAKAERISIERLFEVEESALLGFAYGFVRRREISEELVQEAFLRTHKHWDEIKNPRAWIYRATRNLALNWLRKNGRESEIDDEQLTNAPDHNTDTPDQALTKLEALGTLRSHLAELEPIELEIIRLKYTEDLRYQQIATETGLTLSNVGYKLHHILKSLATSMKSSGFTSPDA
ncbi:RNA polymerase sigma factor [Verrucomicrobiales bacterium]|nr:RNA polymerase sigma factor [Verrucomicrobiales bacterium]